MTLEVTLSNPPHFEDVILKCRDTKMLLEVTPHGGLGPLEGAGTMST